MGKSSSAEVAANAITARTSCSVSVGKSARISAVSAPSARLARIVRTVTRVPLMTGWPPHTPGSRIIRSVYSILSPICPAREHTLTVVRTAKYVKGCPDIRELVPMPDCQRKLRRTSEVPLPITSLEHYNHPRSTQPQPDFAANERAYVMRFTGLVATVLGWSCILLVSTAACAEDAAASKLPGALPKLKTVAGIPVFTTPSPLGRIELWQLAKFGKVTPPKRGFSILLFGLQMRAGDRQVLVESMRYSFEQGRIKSSAMQVDTQQVLSKFFCQYSD